MANVLKWTDRALEEYDKLLAYLYSEWGEEIMLRVVLEVEKTTLCIQKSPEQFPVVLKRRNVRRCVMSPQTSIFFKVKTEYIEISSVFDNRQNPRKRKLYW
ncbi:MAG: type II toxin-antitoxin system RelE/ParE family toxin [Bacteroidetes bacterium]|nr:type II toxin-antitoxin system RelE/ParE family toxin [Bacteroidota bacterium]